MKSMRYIREEVFGLTRHEFAALLDINPVAVWYWERAVRSPSFDSLERIREAAMARGIKWQDRWFFQKRDDAA